MVEKILNGWSLLFLNIALILGSELLGGGTFFLKTGLIHVFAICFVALSIFRIANHQYTFDPVLEHFVHASTISFAVLAASHVVEFMSYQVFRLPYDVVFANVVNFYLASIIILIVGVLYFFKNLYQKSNIFLWLSVGTLIILGILTVAFISNGALISLEPGSLAITWYVGATAAIGLVGVYLLSQIKRTVSIVGPFAAYLRMGTIFMIIAALINIFYETIGARLNVPDYQLVYFSHFAFYAATSLIYLSFGELNKIKQLGLYSQIENVAR